MMTIDRPLQGASTRVNNLLLKIGISTPAECAEYSAAQLRAVRGAGAGFVEEVRSALGRHGLELSTGADRSRARLEEIRRSHGSAVRSYLREANDWRLTAIRDLIAMIDDGVV